MPIFGGRGGGLDAGDVFVRVGATVDSSGFDRYDRLYAQARALPDVEKDLRVNVHGDRELSAMARAMGDVETRARGAGRDSNRMRGVLSDLTSEARRVNDSINKFNVNLGFLSGRIQNVARAGIVLAPLLASIAGGAIELAGSLGQAALGAGALGAAAAAAGGAGLPLLVGVVTRVAAITQAWKDRTAAATQAQVENSRSTGQAVQQARAMRDAREALVRAERSYGEAVDRAREQITAARRDEANAERDVKQAGQEVHQARQQAEADVRRAADTERQAAHDVVDATRQVTSARREATVAARDARRETQLSAIDAASARLDVKDAGQEVADAQQSLNDLSARGQQGTREYADAEERLQRARLAQQRAVIAVGQAQDRANDAQKRDREFREQGLAAYKPYLDALQKLRDARDKERAAIDERNRVEQQGIDRAPEVVSALNRQRDAVDRLRDSRAKLRQLERQGVAGDPGVISAGEGVRDARQRVGDVRADAAQQESAANAKAQVSVQSLDASERRLLDTVTRLSSVFKREMRPAQDAVFDGASDAITTTIPLLHRYSGAWLDLGRVIGNQQRAAARDLTDPASLRALDTITGHMDDLAQDAGRGLRAIGRIFLQVARVAMPDLVRSTDSVADSLERVADQAESGRLDRRIRRWIGSFHDWFDLIRDTGDLLVTVLGGGAREGDGLVRSLDDIVSRWDRFLESDEGQRKMARFFDRSAQNLRDMVRFIGGFVTGVKDLLDALEPVAHLFARIVTAVLGIDRGTGGVEKIGRVLGVMAGLKFLGITGMASTLLKLAARSGPMQALLSKLPGLSRLGEAGRNQQAAGEFLTRGTSPARPLYVLDVGGGLGGGPGGALRQAERRTPGGVIVPAGARSVVGAGEQAVERTAGRGILGGLLRGGVTRAAVGAGVRGAGAAALGVLGGPVGLGLTAALTLGPLVVGHFMKDTKSMGSALDELVEKARRKAGPSVDAFRSELLKMARQARSTGTDIDRDLAGGLQRTADRVSDAIGPRWQRQIENSWQNFRRSGATSMQAIRDEADRNMRIVRDRLGTNTDAGRKVAARNMDLTADAIRDAMRRGRISVDDASTLMRDLMDKRTDRGRKLLSDHFDDAARATAKKMGTTVGSIRDAMRDGRDLTDRGSRRIRDLLIDSLTSLGLSREQARAKLKTGTIQTDRPKLGGNTAGRTGGPATGGFADTGEYGFVRPGGGWFAAQGGYAPGSGFIEAAGGMIGNAFERGRDRVHAILGRGEAVLNHWQQRIVNWALQRTGMRGGLRDVFSRTRGMKHYMADGGIAGEPQAYAAGGIVPVPGFPGEEAAASVIPKIRDVIHRFPGLVVTDAFDRDHSAGHQSAGHNITGTAVDFDGPDPVMDAAVASLVRAGYLVGYDGRFGSQDWPGHGPSTRTSNHHFHVEFGGPGGNITGGIAAAIAKIISPRITGAGTFGAIGDRGLRITTAAANEQVQRIADEMNAGPDVGVGGAFRDLPDTGGGSPGANRKLAQRMYAAAQDRLGGDFSMLDYIIMNESSYNQHAQNPTSPAYGIPQALPGSKMASAGGDWHDNPATQLRWMFNYIVERYGSLPAAYAYKRAHGVYDEGGLAGDGDPVVFAAAGLPPAATGTHPQVTTHPITGGTSPSSWGKRINASLKKIVNRIPGLTDDIQRWEDRYTALEGRYATDPEDFIVLGDKDHPAHVNDAAIRKRQGHIDELVKLRKRIEDLMGKQIDRIREQRAAVQEGIRRLRLALKGAKGKDRPAYRRMIANFRRQYTTAGTDLLEARNALDASRGDRSTLTDERAGLLGQAQQGIAELDVAQGGPAPPDELPQADTTAADIQRAAQDLMNTFNAQRADLYANFGRNFTAPGENPFAEATGMAAGARYFGAGSTSVQPAMAAATGAGAVDNLLGPPGGATGPGGRNVTVNNYYRYQPADTHTWSRDLDYELRAAGA